jgi:hypothetical protein
VDDDGNFIEVPVSKYIHAAIINRSGNKAESLNDGDS